MTETAPDVLGWLRTRAIADADGNGAMFQEAATMLYDFKINAKALLVYCDSTGSGDAIYSLQCLRRLVERMESPNARFDANGSFYNDSTGWILRSRPSRARVAAVFDNSIQLIKEM